MLPSAPTCCVAWLSAALLAICAQLAQASTADQFKAQCAACHGAQASGNPGVDAPPLAGQDADYLVRQLLGFRQGHRGAEGAATSAVAMRVVAQTLVGEADIQALANYASKLKGAAQREPTPTNTTVKNQGKALFGVCVACHGAKAEGTAELFAPRLNHLPSKYLIAQLQAYRNGHRGNRADDRLGQQMRQVASEALSSDEDCAAVAAYIATLRGAR